MEFVENYQPGFLARRVARKEICFSSASKRIAVNTPGITN